MRGETEVPIPGLLGRALAGLYGTGSAAYHALYDRGWRRPHRLPVPVLSVGNLTVGGTGKTPTVIALIEALTRRGRRPGVLTRGYGGADTGRVPPDRTDPGVWQRFGDEPVLLAGRFPGVPIQVDPDRTRGGRALLASPEAPDVLVLDDGFQHRKLARDADLVLLDAARPLGNGRLLPAGPLRERPAALSRATHLLMTGWDEHIGTASRPREPLTTGLPCFRARTVVDGIRRLEGGAHALLGKGERVHLVTGVARPQRVRASAQQAGLHVTGHSVFPDHHPFTAGELSACEDAARDADAIPLTTEKDAVRMVGVTRDPWLLLSTRLEVVEGVDRLLDALLGTHDDGETGSAPPS